MTFQEASRAYHIPKDILREYEKLCVENKFTVSNEFTDVDLERLGLVVTLRDAGFDNEQIGTYMQLFVQGERTRAERLRMLNEKRRDMLDEIHLCERQLDRLDYLRYEIQKFVG